MTTEARDRLARTAFHTMTNLGTSNTVPDILREVVDAILTDYESLAALVDWAELLAAGERVGTIKSHTRWITTKIVPLFPQMNKEIKVREYRLADQPNGADAPTEQKGNQL